MNEVQLRSSEPTGHHQAKGQSQLEQLVVQTGGDVRVTLQRTARFHKFIIETDEESTVDLICVVKFDSNAFETWFRFRTK